VKSIRNIIMMISTRIIYDWFGRSSHPNVCFHASNCYHVNQNRYIGNLFHSSVWLSKMHCYLLLVIKLTMYQLGETRTMACYVQWVLQYHYSTSICHPLLIMCCIVEYASCIRAQDNPRLVHCR
jgi:hypothetical protein